MGPTTPLPTGTVTFIFTDIVGSTRLWEEYPEAMREALARHNTLLTHGIHRHGGTVIKSRGEGDSLFAVFSRASDALADACSLQQALLAEPWPTPTPLRVRMALHTGEADLHEGDYFGPAVNRCARLRAVAHGGQVLLSLAAAEIVRQALPEGGHLVDLGRHGLADLAQPEQVFQLTHPTLPSEFPPLRSLDARANNLPIQPTSLLGREQEVAAVQQLLRREEVRLVTLTGPGGTGKTRLGLQVAAELLDDFLDGVFFVDLVPIREPEWVASTISQTIGVRESGGEPLLEALKAHLRERQLLLLLDNFEQVIGAAPQVAELLTAAPRLKVLVTSRELLRLQGEQEFPVAPLPVPDPERLPPLPSLSQYAAVELFIQRAVNATPDFAVTNENAPAVAEICHRLDGLPLAIELAAARMKLFSPHALLSRLEDRLRVLTGGARDLPTRQQTLRNALAWSHDLLSEAEKQLFRRLSIFVGGCTLEAAEAVCQTEGDPAIDILDGMASLVHKSLLQQKEFGEADPRFSMLETIRAYAREQLTASGEAEAIRRQHVSFFLALAEEAETSLIGPDAATWLDRLELEHDNLRAALRGSVERNEAHTALRLGAALAELLADAGSPGGGVRATDRDPGAPGSAGAHGTPHESPHGGWESGSLAGRPSRGIRLVGGKPGDRT